MQRRGGAVLDKAIRILQDAGHSVTMAPTTGPGTAGGIARDHIARGADLIVTAGGDGTINEVVEGMVHSRVPLAILPGGTANVLAMELRLGSRLDRAAERLAACRPERISVGLLTCDEGRIARHFMLMTGAGVDAHIVYRVNQDIKSRVGKFAYWLAGWSLLGENLELFRVDVAGETHQCSFALVSKVCNYGGDFEIARSVHLTDEEFEVVLLGGRSTVRYVKYFSGMILNRLSAMKGVRVLRADRVILTPLGSCRVCVQIDGEFAGHLPAEIRIVPDALTLLVPPSYSQRAAARDLVERHPA